MNNRLPSHTNTFKVQLFETVTVVMLKSASRNHEDHASTNADKIINYSEEPRILFKKI